MALHGVAYIFSISQHIFWDLSIILLQPEVTSRLFWKLPAQAKLQKYTCIAQINECFDVLDPVIRREVCDARAFRIQ